MQPFSPWKLAAAYGFDLMAGDPHGMPHPVRLMGAFISRGELICKPGANRSRDFSNGMLLSVLTVAGSFVAGWLAIRQARSLHPGFGTALEVALAWTTLATRSLLCEAGSVVRALEAGAIEDARHSLSMIVGRDTDTLNEPEIERAVIETVAEGLCDGVAAPLFYLAVGGVPLALAYKALNTLDSMIGHPEPHYTYFGRFAARADDVANWLPARLTSLGIVLAAGMVQASPRGAWRAWLEDGDKHPSPNAAQSESAMAGALSVQLGGMNHYDGRPSPKPLLGGRNRMPTAEDATQSLRLARVGSAALFVGTFAWCTWKRSR